MLAQCPCFESEGSDSTERGDKRHKAFEALLTFQRADSAQRALASNAESLLKELPEAERDGVEWAAEYVRCKSNSQFPLQVERRVSVMDDAFNEVISGTPDVVCANEIFDLKWSWFDYTAQFAAYALALLQDSEFDSVTVHLLFAESKREQILQFTRESAEAVVLPILKAAQDPERKPRLCDYCGWCSKALLCPAKLAQANEIVQAREDVPAEAKAKFADWLKAGAHTTQISDGQTMGTVLTIARSLKDFVEAAEHRAKEMALKEGVIPVGYKLQSRQGNRFITDVAGAYSVSGLPQDEFLRACEVKFSALCDVHQKLHGSKKAAAEREVETKLGSFVQRKSPSQSLVKEKETNANV